MPPHQELTVIPMCSICHKLYVSETRCLRPKLQFQEMSVLSKNLFKRAAPNVFKYDAIVSRHKYQAKACLNKPRLHIKAR